MASERYDAIVVGGGHNGLVNAAYLAQAGLKTLVLERRHVVGGAAITEDGWLRTGDLGRFDEEGRLHLVGRSKEMIIHSGFNVYPVEVEAALTEHEGVILAAVVGRAVEGNEEVVAFVTCRPEAGLDEAVLQAFLRDRLAPYKVPSRIVIAAALPAAPTGKILKARLLDHFADRL